MANIGEPLREIEIIPLEAPMEVPSTPAPAEEPAPAPERELEPA